MKVCLPSFVGELLIILKLCGQKSSLRNTCQVLLLARKRIVRLFGQHVRKEAQFLCKALNGSFIIDVLLIFGNTFGYLWGLLVIWLKDLCPFKRKLSLFGMLKKMGWLPFRCNFQILSFKPYLSRLLRIMLSFKIHQLGLFLIMVPSLLMLYTFWFKSLELLYFSNILGLENQVKS